MTDDDNVNYEPQYESSETPEDRPMFNPEMIIENAMDPDIYIPDDDLNDYLGKSDD